MPGLKVTDGTGATVDFFISYAPADQEWAEWIGWTLEESGYRIMMQAWDFVGGADFVQLMHRGVEEAARMIAVLSPAYLDSVYGRLEWQAFYRSDPSGVHRRLLPIRVVPCEPTGLLAAITYVDMVGVPDEDTASDRLHHAVRGAVEGRSKPDVKPGFPGMSGRPGDAAGHGARIPPRRQRAIEGRPQFPRALPAGSDAAGATELTILHLADLGALISPPAGTGAGAEADPVGALVADIGAATAESGVRPDLIVASGDLTTGARPSEFDRAGELLSGLAGTFGLGRHRVVIVPGDRDVSVSACRAYFANCEADEIEPAPPYWPKWRHYARMFGEFYRDADKVRFEADRPWTLFEVPELRLVVAGLNSTIARSHRPEDAHGLIGAEQADWFAEALRPYDERGWLRVGAVHHGADADGTGGLADPDVLTGTVAPALSLLLHAGATGTGAEIAGTPVRATGAAPGPDAGPDVEPGAGERRYALLRLRRDDLTQWTRRAGGGDGWAAEGAAVTTARTWRSAHATFPAPGDTAPARRPATGVAATGARRDDPTSLLLTRLAEICGLRYPDATVRRYEGDPPYLLLTHGEDRFFQQLRIAACPGDPTREALDAFVNRVHAIDPEPGSQLVYSGAQPEQALIDEAMRRGVRLRSFAEFRGLLDLRRYVAAQTEALTRDRRYTPGLYVPQRYRDLDRAGEQAEGADLFADVLRMLGDDQGHFLLLLGDFGRGKTFLMRELARRLPEELPHLTPMLIELRTLETTSSLDELIAAHLATSGVERFDLAAFKYMLRTGQLVLLFDGFDEMAVRPTYDRAAERLATLMRAAEGQAKIIVSSRAGSLMSDSQAREALSRVEPIPGRRLLEVRDFTETQMRAFLVNSYDGDEARAGARLDLIRGIRDLLGLASNPRMLAFIADLDDDRLRAAQSADGEVGAANLYRQILDAWLAYEAEVRGGPAARSANLDKARRWEAVMALALRLWNADAPYVTLDDLTDVAGDVIAGLTERRLTAEQAAHVVGSGTLLVRAGEAAFTFVHNSVMEWLVAANIAQSLAHGATDPAPLRGRVISALMAEFLVDLAGYRQCRAWAERILADTKAGEAARANALKINERVREPTGVPVNLRGVNFRGVDLSGRDLRRADLSGADLTDARLVGTDLEGALLAGTKLAGARLDRARMRRADLTGADLTGARLLGTDLRDATTDDVTWRRAALVAVEGRAELTGTSTSGGPYGAAVVPGSAVETELAPATVGIAHSFRNGALPGLLAFSPDGGVLAVGDETGAVVLCDAFHGVALRTLTGHHDRVYTLAFTPSGDRLVTAGEDEEVRLWDPMTGECVQLLGGHATPVWSVQFSPDGDLLVTADSDGVVREWDVATGACRRTRDDHDGSVWAVRFSPDGTRLITAGDDHSVPVYDTATGEHLRTLRGHGAPIWWAHFNNDGSLLATCDARGEVRLSSVETGHCLRTLRGHEGAVWSAAFSPDGALVATAGDDHTVRVFDTATGACRHVLEGHTGPVWVALFSPDGDRLVTASSDHDLRVWDPVGGEPLRRLRGHTGPVWACVFSADGSLLASTSNDDTVLIWDPATGERRDKLAGHIERLSSVVYHPDGHVLLSTSNDGRAHLWDPGTGAYRHALPGHTGRIGSAEFTPDGARVAIPGNLGDVRMWDVETGRHHHSLGADTDQVWSVAFSPDGRMLATANDDDTVRLWTVNTDRLIRTLTGHVGRVRSLTFSADGTTLATACDDRTVRLWNPATGRCRHVLDGHGDRVWQVAFSPDGALLASASYDATVRLWDTVTGRPTRALLGHAGRVRSVAFSPDGRLLATSGDDRTVRLWDVAAGGELWTLRDYTDPARSVAFSPDGTQLATASDDGAVRLWDLRDGAPAARVVLIGLPDGGWAAASRDGRYKLSGDPAGKFWHVVGACRFEPGELDPYVTGIRRLEDDAPF